MVRLSPEKGHSGALGGDTRGDPMFTDVSLVQHLSCHGGAGGFRVPLLFHPWEVGLGAAGLLQGEGPSAWRLIVNPPRDGQVGDGDQGSIRCMVPIHLPLPEVSTQDRDPLPRTPGCSGGETREPLCSPEGLSLTMLRAREEVWGADPAGPPALEDSRVAGVEVGVQVAGPSQLTGEHRGVQAALPEPSALRRALAFNSSKRKTKQNKPDWQRWG